MNLRNVNWRCLTALVLVTVSLGCANKTLPPDPVVTSRIDSILHRHDEKQLHYGARVIDLMTGQEVYAHDIDRPLLPASNGKIAVAAAGLDFFGPSHTFKTYLAIDGYDLWLIGTGDPAIGDAAIAKIYGQTTTTVLNEWCDALKARGVRVVKGNLYYYEGALEDVQVHPSWSKSFAGDWYAAPVGGLNFNDNCVDIAVMPTAEGQPAGYAVMPPVRNIKVVNQCTSASTGKPDIDREPGANVYTLKGAATQPTTLPSKSVTEPGAFFADALRTHLETHGVHVQGKTVKAEKPLGKSLVPPAEKIVAVHQSKMSDIMWRINKSSQNLFAEAMCKLLGRATLEKQKLDVPGSWTNGATAVRAFLHKNDINTNGYVIVDGSGLSRDNRVTAHLVSDVFKTMYHHPYYEDFRKSLSAAGEDGTLRARMKDIKGHFFGKTGYIGGVRSLSGYVKTKSGRWLAVSMIFNGIDGSVKPVEEMQDDVVRLLVNYPNIPATQTAAR